VILPRLLLYCVIICSWQRWSFEELEVLWERGREREREGERE